MIESKYIGVMSQSNGLLMPVELKRLGYLGISKSVMKLKESFMKN